MASWFHKFISAVAAIIGITTSHPPPSTPPPAAPATFAAPAPTTTIPSSETHNANLMEIVSLLKGNGLTRFADGLDLVQDIVMRGTNSSAAIFAPEDPEFNEFSGLCLTHMVRKYIVPGRFEFKDLAALSNQTVLQTINPEKSVEITTAFDATSGKTTVSINGAIVSKPDVCSNAEFVVHAISRPYD